MTIFKILQTYWAYEGFVGEFESSKKLQYPYFLKFTEKK